MFYTPLFGTNLDDFIEQGPEREGVLKIPTRELAPVVEGDTVLGSISKATRIIFLQCVALQSAIDKRQKQICASDSMKAHLAFDEEKEKLIAPAMAALKNRLNVQIGLDVLAAKGDPSAYLCLLVDDDEKIIGFTDNLSLQKRIRLMAERA